MGNVLRKLMMSNYKMNFKIAGERKKTLVGVCF